MEMINLLYVASINDTFSSYLNRLIGTSLFDLILSKVYIYRKKYKVVRWTKTIMFNQSSVKAILSSYFKEILEATKV